jgi:hypothetical protein
MASLFQSLEKEQLLVMYRKAQLFQMKEYEDRLLEIGLSKDPAVDFLIEKYAKELKAHSRKAHKIKSEIRKRTDQSIEAEWEMALLLFEARKKKYQDTVRIAAPLEKFLRRYGSSDPKTLWKCYFVLAEFYKSRGDLQKADQNVEGALRGAPTELHSFISRLKDKRS